MAAATGDQQRLRDAVPRAAPAETHTVLASQTIYQGAVGMQVAGKARNLVAATASSTLLGVAFQQYAAGGSDLVTDDGSPQVWERGVFGFAGDAAALPDETYIDKTVYFLDNNTVTTAAPGAPNLGGTLRSIRQGLYWVEL